MIFPAAIVDAVSAVVRSVLRMCAAVFVACVSAFAFNVAEANHDQAECTKSRSGITAVYDAANQTCTLSSGSTTLQCAYSPTTHGEATCHQVLDALDGGSACPTFFSSDTGRCLYICQTGTHFADGIGENARCLPITEEGCAMATPGNPTCGDECDSANPCGTGTCTDPDLFLSGSDLQCSDCVSPPILASDSGACVSQCPAGEESDGATTNPQCVACEDGEYSEAGGACMTCDGVASADKTSCAPNRTVAISLVVNGTLFARAGGTMVANGGTVPDGTTITFTADPDDGFYVSGWTGCDSQNTGGHSDGDNKECVATANANLEVGATFADMDECAAGTHTCGSNATCENTVGSYRCPCDGGYKQGAGGTDTNPMCEDIDECAPENIGSSCEANQICENRAGADPVCTTCENGGTRSGTNICDCVNDWGGDTCETPERVCANGGTRDDTTNTCTCVNDWGGDTCEDPERDCNSGTRDDTTNTCDCSGSGHTGTTCTTDINECAEGTDTCGDKEKCRNTMGSFACDRLPEVWIVAPAGEAFRAAPESGCEIRKWTESCDGRDAALSDCTPDGTGMVTVGVVFDCGN